MKNFAKSNVIQIVTPLFRLLAFATPVVVFLKHVEADVHPVADDLLGDILGEMLCDRPTADRVGTDARRTPTGLVLLHRFAGVYLAVVRALPGVLARTSGPVDAVSER